MYYIYKIENLINHKKYIGLTNNIKRRRNRHFTDLRCNRHDNNFLQKEFNIYGIENFSFEEIYAGDISIEEIGKKEQFYIKLYDSYYNGYNQNEGGNFGPSNGGSTLTKTDIFSICAALEFCSKPGQVLADMFGVSRTTISRIKRKVNHTIIIEEYEKMSDEQRKDLYNIFIESSNFYDLKCHTTVYSSKRKFTQEQVFMMYINEEFNIMPKTWLIEKLHIGSSNSLYTILKHNSYKDYWLDYQKLSFEQKKELASLLRNQ